MGCIAPRRKRVGRGGLLPSARSVALRATGRGRRGTIAAERRRYTGKAQNKNRLTKAAKSNIIKVQESYPIDG